MMKQMLLSCLAVAGLLSSVPSFAHHALTDYNDNQTKTLEGALVALHMKNPHTVMVLEVRGANGTAERWTIEWLAALLLERQGVVRTTLAPGDHLVVTGRRAVNGDDHRLWLRTIMRPADQWTWTGGF